MKVQTESFHLNGHILGFRLHTQTLESPYKTPSNTLAVKGLSEKEMVQIYFCRKHGSKSLIKMRLKPWNRFGKLGQLHFQLPTVMN